MQHPHSDDDGRLSGLSFCFDAAAVCVLAVLVEGTVVVRGFVLPVFHFLREGCGCSEQRAVVLAVGDFAVSAV